MHSYGICKYILENVRISNGRITLEAWPVNNAGIHPRRVRKLAVQVSETGRFKSFILFGGRKYFLKYLPVCKILYIFAACLHKYSTMKNKKERLFAIQDIIRTQSVCSQEELLKLLKSKGFNSTQATLSRDIKALKIAKSPDMYGDYVYTLPPETRVQQKKLQVDERQLIMSGFISIEFSGDLAVIKTRPGYAMGIASDIDGKAGREVLGTIAGDDTILLIPREGVSRKRIVEILSGQLKSEELKIKS
jgi:transcriptional regulator of arginine metabolism